MTKSILISFSVILFITACGGKSSDEDKQFITGKTVSEEEQEESENTIKISGNNQSRTVSPTFKQSVIVSGSNNFVTINTTPRRVSITGNDNTIRIENRGLVSNSGSGNMILSLNGSSPVLN